MGRNRFNVLKESARWSMDEIKRCERILNTMRENPSGKKYRIAKMERYISQCERAYESKLSSIKVDKRKFEADERQRKVAKYSDYNG